MQILVNLNDPADIAAALVLMSPRGAVGATATAPATPAPPPAPVAGAAPPPPMAAPAPAAPPAAPPAPAAPAAPAPAPAPVAAAVSATGKGTPQLLAQMAAFTKVFKAAGAKDRLKQAGYDKATDVPVSDLDRVFSWFVVDGQVPAVS